MKIGLVCPYNIAKGGGVKEIIFAVQDELIKRGYDAKVVTPLARDTDPIDRPNVVYIGTSTDFRSPTRTQIQISTSADSDKIKDMLETEKFDILHFHEPWIPDLSRQILQRSDSVNIATFHAKVPETLMSRTVIKAVTPYLKSVMKYLNVLTAVSDSAAEYVTSLTNEPVTIIPNGIDLSKYKVTKPKKTTHGKTLLFIGRLEGRKGVKYLLQAYKILEQNNPDIKLIIAGNGPDREKLEMLAEDLKLKNVTFLGFVDDELKIQLLAEADLFVSPAIYGESFGIVLLEAMATGTVCVAGDNSGYSDVMQGVGALSIVDTKNIEAFASRMQMLLQEEAIRKVWLAWAKEYVQQFSYEHIVDGYEELYKTVLKQHVKTK